MFYKSIIETSSAAHTIVVNLGNAQQAKRAIANIAQEETALSPMAINLTDFAQTDRSAIANMRPIRATHGTNPTIFAWIATEPVAPPSPAATRTKIEEISEMAWITMLADDDFVSHLATVKTTISTIYGLAAYLKGAAQRQINLSYPAGHLTYVLASRSIELCDWVYLAEKHWYDVQVGSFTAYARKITQRVR